MNAPMFESLAELPVLEMMGALSANVPTSGASTADLLDGFLPGFGTSTCGSSCMSLFLCDFRKTFLDKRVKWMLLKSKDCKMWTRLCRT